MTQQHAQDLRKIGTAQRGRPKGGKAKAVRFVQPALRVEGAEPIAKPTRQRDQHNGGTVRDVLLDPNSQRRGFRAAAECMLDVYLLRGQLGKGEHDAGMRIRRAVLRSHGIKIDDSLTMSGGGNGTREDMLNAKTEAERFLSDVKRVLNIDEREVVLSVCGYDDTAGTARRIVMLRRGLEKMGREWGMI